MRAEVYDVHTVDIAVPYPLTETEIADLRAKKAAELVAAAPPADGVALASMATVDPAQAADPLAGVDLNALALENAVARGKHLVEARYGCQICHGADYTGGPIEGGDPAWPPAPNLTQAGVGSWTYEAFDKAVRSGVRKDGQPMQRPMADVLPMLGHTTPDETRALWAFFQTLPAKPTK
jgi:cytochrome c5